jgi:hypothetical protein
MRTRRFVAKVRSSSLNSWSVTRVLVQAKVCKADLAEGAMPGLTASRVVAHPAKAAKTEEDD